MTIAIDKRTGKVCGQVTTYAAPNPEPTFPDNVRGNVVRLLTRDGYVYVPRDSVRLEEVED